MSAATTSGKLKKTSKTVFRRVKYQYRWEIEGYSNLDKNLGEYVESPNFTFDLNGNSTWNLRLYPKGLSEDHKDNVQAYLYLLTTGNGPVRYSFKLHFPMPGLDNPEVCSLSSAEIKEHKLGCSGGIQVHRANLSKFTFKNALVLCCDIESCVASDTVPDTSEEDAVHEREYLSSLLHNENFSDVTIKVQDEKFKCHKLVLGMSSPVFERMFLTDMRERGQKLVKIGDCDPKIFGKMLEFIYSGKFTPEYKDELFLLADKYDIKKLKKLCETTYVKDITVENVISLLIKASNRNCLDLKSKCCQFIYDNFSHVRERQEFYDMLRDEGGLAKHLMKFLWK